MDAYIETEWLKAVRGTAFYYPAAFCDHAEPLSVLKDHVNEFWFCDISYQRGLNLKPALPNQQPPPEVSYSGDTYAEKEQRYDSDGNPYWFLAPSCRLEMYPQTGGKSLKVMRRRGFGQVGLTVEFPRRSIGVFMHRGDSPGEGGSNVSFFANKNLRYEPGAHLFTKLQSRLTDRALVITDGSNAPIRFLTQFQDQSIDGSEAYSRLRGSNYTKGEFSWTCVGWCSRRNGPTLVWGLSQF